MSAGRHDIKLGGEILVMNAISQNCRECNGIIDAQGGVVPATIQELFPVWNDVSTWNLAALSPITRAYRLAVGTLPTENPRQTFGGWLQDDWAVTDRLTLNLGVRYDLLTNVFGNDVALPPFPEAGRPDDTNNIAPRLGAAFKLNESCRATISLVIPCTASTCASSSGFLCSRARVLPRELRHVHDRREQRALRPALAERERRLPAAHAAARVPVDVLRRRTSEKHGTRRWPTGNWRATDAFAMMRPSSAAS
jgi:hypothetical protein